MQADPFGLLAATAPGARAFPAGGALAPTPEAELLTAPDGTRYHAWDGFVRTGHDLQRDFVGVAYPDAGPLAHGIDLWARFNAAGEATDVLECNATGRYLYPQCKLHQKIEPLFVKANFDRRGLDNLKLIVKRPQAFTEYLKEGMR